MSLIKVTKPLIEWLKKNVPKRCPAVDPNATWETHQNTFTHVAADAIASGTLTPEKYSELTRNKDMSRSPTAAEVYGGTKSADYTHIRVKEPSESLSEKRVVGVHKKTGKPVMDTIYQQPATLPSEASAARAGVLLKHLACKAGIQQARLSEWERGLLDEVCETKEWCGQLGNEFHDNIPGGRNVKQLIDDAASGGIFLTPVEFDADIISFPLLGGELYPLVDVKPVERGRRIEGASLATPTLTWGEGDATTAPLFATAGMSAAINTTIYGASAAILVGRDFLADSPANVGAELVRLIGERLANELDRVIAVGAGGVEPTGFNTNCGTLMTTTNAGARPPTLDDYTTLLFSVPKVYRQKNLNLAFVSNDVTYMRSKQIAVDATGAGTDQRPVLSPLTDINKYETLGWPHRVCNNIANTDAHCLCLSKYRLYRRTGLSIEWSTQGQTLMRDNLALLVCRTRVGGKLVDANAGAEWADGQA